MAVKEIFKGKGSPRKEETEQVGEIRPVSDESLSQCSSTTILFRAGGRRGHHARNSLAMKGFQNFIVDRYSSADAFFPSMIGKQHLKHCKWNGVRSGTTVVYFWSFSLFWCRIEVWFTVSLSVAVGAAMCFFPQSH